MNSKTRFFLICAFIFLGLMAILTYFNTNQLSSKGDRMSVKIDSVNSKIDSLLKHRWWPMHHHSRHSNSSESNLEKLADTPPYLILLSFGGQGQQWLQNYKLNIVYLSAGQLVPYPVNNNPNSTANDTAISLQQGIITQVQILKPDNTLVAQYSSIGPDEYWDDDQMSDAAGKPVKFFVAWNPSAQAIVITDIDLGPLLNFTN
jgi:hypothetical protein